MTGYPSIDKPWLQYYDNRVIDQKLPQYSMYEYIYRNNEKSFDNIALEYYGQTISRGILFLF